MSAEASLVPQEPDFSSIDPVIQDWSAHADEVLGFAAPTYKPSDAAPVDATVSESVDWTKATEANLIDNHDRLSGALGRAVDARLVDMILNPKSNNRADEPVSVEPVPSADSYTVRGIESAFDDFAVPTEHDVTVRPDARAAIHILGSEEQAEREIAAQRTLQSASGMLKRVNEVLGDSTHQQAFRRLSEQRGQAAGNRIRQRLTSMPSFSGRFANRQPKPPAVSDETNEAGQ